MTAEPVPRELVDGATAIVRGALDAGCTFFAGYPITPASSILAAMMRALRGAEPNRTDEPPRRRLVRWSCGVHGRRRAEVRTASARADCRARLTGEVV